MKKSRLFLLALMLVLLVSVCLTGCQEAEPQETEPPVMEAYYNMEGAKYNDNGVSSRPAESDGTYKVLFSQKGKAVTKTVAADKELINKIDSMNILGLVCDEAGVVTGVKTVEDMGGKIIAEGYHVLTYARGKMMAYAKKDFSDEGIEMAVTSRNSYVVNVTEEEPMRIFELIKGDKIIAVQDAQGIITDVFFYEGGDIRNGKDQFCPCADCKEKGKTETHFEAWLQSSSGVGESGHYFLIEDLELADQLSMAANVKFTLDLNGYTVTVSEEKRVASVHNEGAYFALMDSSEAQTGKMMATDPLLEKNGNGAVVWVRYGTFELFSGTLDASQCVSGGHGAVVNIPNGSTFNMYGGTIIGGTTKPMELESGGKSAGGHGGALYISGTFNMYDGLVKGGTALANGTGRGRGGCIAIMGDGVMNMYGGEVIGGTDDGGYNEGLMYINKGGVFNHEGGTITEAPATETPSTDTPATEAPSTEG